MKRVAVICNYVLKPDRIGGMDRFFQKFDTELKSSSCEVDWFFSEFKSFDFYNELNIFSNAKLSVEQNFLDKIDANHYDIVITHFTELCTPFYKQLKRKLPNSYCIAVDHNPRPFKGLTFKKRIKKRLEGILYSKYIDQFVGVSKYTVNNILMDYGTSVKNKTHVVYNGIDTNVFKKRISNNRKRFIVASHLRPSKGIQDLLLALKDIDDSLLVEVSVDIYGEGPFKDQLMSQTTNCGLDSVVNFKGSSPDLHNLFCGYSYMIQPTYMECFSLSILESLSANVPVITTQVGGNLEVIEDNLNGFIFPAGSISELANILESIIKGEYEIIEDTSNLINEKYTLDLMVKNHINLLP